MIGAGHGDFSDFAGFIQQFTPGYTDPSGYYGPIPAARATRATRQVLTAFFDRFLRGAQPANGLLDAPTRFNHDLMLLHK